MKEISVRDKRRIFKIRQMILQGTPGEKQAAKNQLDKLLKSLELTYEDLEEMNKENKSFEIFFHSENNLPFEERLLYQIMRIIIKDENKFVKVLNSSYFHSKHKKIVINDVDELTAIEIKNQYDYFYSFLRDDLNDCYVAFLLKNNLLFDDKTDKKSEKKMSLEKIKKIQNIADSFDENIYHKQIKKGS